MKLHRGIKITGLVLGLSSAAASADLQRNGTIANIGSYPATGDISLTESWSWLELTDFDGEGICDSGGGGQDSLAYLAYPNSEKGLKSMVLAAYTKKKNVAIVLDESNLLQGFCRIKKLVLIPS